MLEGIQIMHKPTVMTTFVAMLLAPLTMVTTSNAQGLSERIQAVAKQRQAARKNDTSKASMLGALIYTDLSVDFDETAAKDVFSYLRKALGINLVVRYDTDKGGLGIDPDTPITMKVQNQPALTIIEMILEQCGDLDPCTWQLRNGFVEIGTKERLSLPSAQELRMYPVRDLMFEVPYFDNAPDFSLQGSISQGGGGGGSGGGSGGGGGGFGGGGGGGFGGGGSGGGGSGGGGGGFLGDPGEAPERMSEEEKAQQLVDLIQETIEPDAWRDLGGDWASMRYYQGVLIIRAPDWIHRQIDGYPFAPRRSASMSARGGRYVTFTAPISIVENVEFKPATVQGGAGGATAP